MSKRERIFSNTGAQRKPEAELRDVLVNVFIEVEGRPPNAEELSGLKEAAEWVKTNLVNWSQVEDGLRDQTWRIEAGPRDLMGEG